jgi:mono/diheme cytochrome c family protein
MPVWGPVISTSQVADLVAYVRAGLPDVPYARPVAVPRGQGAAVAGAALYVRYGCINCHGPNGLGGVPNPQSPDKTIPPLSGQDFRKEFNTDAKIIAVIRSGSVIGKPPITSMPHWGGIIPDRDLKALVAYPEDAEVAAPGPWTARRVRVSNARRRGRGRGRGRCRASRGRRPAAW